MLLDLKMIMEDKKTRTHLMVLFSDGSKMYGYCSITSRCNTCFLRYECFTNKGWVFDAESFFGYYKKVIPDMEVYPNDINVEKSLVTRDKDTPWDYEFVG